MSLNDFQFPSIVLQGLFNQSLIEIKTVEKKEEKKVSQPFFTLGNNLGHIVILVDCNETLHLPDDQLNFLLGILAACHLTMEDVAILNIKKNKSVTYQSVTRELKAKKLLLFGVSPVQFELPLDFPHYQIQQYNQQIYLTAPPLSHLQDNVAEKTKLWNCLRQIFTV